MEDWESDSIIEKWLIENDHNVMPLPSIEFNPHLLISKVRKHYMEYLIKLLSVNYENHQKLINKNIYLPSAIWRCAKIMEMSAAQASMVVQLYRENINSMIKELKNNTNTGFLNRKLYECLHYSPDNEKKTQTSFKKFNECNCQCSCNRRKKLKQTSQSPKIADSNEIDNSNTAYNLATIPISLLQNNLNVTQNNENCVSHPPKIKQQLSMDLQNSDEIMQQLEKLFQDDNEDDLFDGALCTADDPKTNEENTKLSQFSYQTNDIPQQMEDKAIQDPKSCLDDRLSVLSGLLVNNECMSRDSNNKKNKKSRQSKWLCEGYFQKVKLFELLDQIRDCDRNKLSRIKEMLLDLFGEDSDDEGVLSPFDGNPEFEISCKERITPWVVKILTPYYVNGRIRGKSLFKALAKHLIRIIYQCSKYPHQYEVHSFVKDFLESHKMIRCEADFKEFRIENV